MSMMDGSNFIAWAARQQSTHNLFNNETVVDHVLPDMIHLIDPHWYQFPPMDSLWYRILGCVIGVLGITSILGNGMVIYIFSSTKTLRTPSNLLVVNLAVSDFLMMCCISPVMVVNCYYETWVFGPLHCTVDSTLAGLFGGVSIWTMTFVALDRYNVIVKGLSAKPLTIKSALLRIFAVWLISLSCAIAPALGWSRYVPEGNLTACGCDYLAKDWSSRSYIIIYSIVAYFIPLSIIIYSYWFIVKAVAAHEKSMREQAKKMNVASLRSSEAQQTSAECKLAKIALMTISLWFMAWTPYLITNYIGIFEMMKLTPIMTIWCSLFSKSSAVYNPIVYAISHPKYRQALEKKFPSLVCGTEPDDTKSQTSDVTHATNPDDTPTTA